MNLTYEAVEHYDNLFERNRAIIMTNPWFFGFIIILLTMGWLLMYYGAVKKNRDMLIPAIIMQIFMYMMFIPMTIVGLASGHDVTASKLAGKGYYQSEPMEVTHIDKVGETIDGGYKLVTYEMKSKDGHSYSFDTEKVLKGIRKGETVRLTTKEAVLVNKDDEVEATYDSKSLGGVGMMFTPSDMTLRKVD